MTTFIHYRKFDRMGQIKAKGGLTLAIKSDGEYVYVATAKCGQKDNFDRKLGRTIAEGRLNSGSPEHTHTLKLPPDTKVKSFVHNQEFVRKEVEKLLAGAK